MPLAGVLLEDAPGDSAVDGAPWRLVTVAVAGSGDVPRCLAPGIRVRLNASAARGAAARGSVRRRDVGADAYHGGLERLGVNVSAGRGPGLMAVPV
ncbi:hypothetical protein JCM9957A_15240 [Kineosporia succinea]